ncbi:MAG: LptE family protein [Chlorobiales bacterium]|nr:LptE family protein [Chlorobiales bacterium]
MNKENNLKTFDGRRLLLSFIIALLPVLSGCYSFSQGSLPEHIKTISIPVFGDETRSGIGQLRERLTTQMTDKIQSQSSLVILQSSKEANSVLDGVIKSYSDVPSQVSSQTERATQNRITITVAVTYRDNVAKKTLFTQNFTGFADYAIGDFSGQQEAITKAITNVTDDVLNKVLAGTGW